MGLSLGLYLLVKQLYNQPPLFNFDGLNMFESAIYGEIWGCITIALPTLSICNIL